MKILGHRGDGTSNKTPELRELRREQGKLPENTLAAFKKVLSAGADGIEFDIIISADGRAMVIHDDDVSLHAVDGSVGLVSEKSFEELRWIDVGDGETIPTLEEVIEAAGKEKILNIELKSDDSAEIVVRIVQEYIGQGWKCENFVISAFNSSLLKTVKQLDSSLQVGLLFERGESLENIPGMVKEYEPFSIHPDRYEISEEMMLAAKENNLIIIGWTSGEVAEERDWFTRLEKYNDIWLITDFPELVVR